MLTVLELLRVRDWAKNLFVFLPLIFGGGLFAGQLVLKALEAFACFCLISSTIYIVNDLHDRSYDSRHPLKRNRPLASGAVSATAGIACALAAGCACFVLALFWFAESLPVIGAIAAYALLNLCYTFWLKNLAIIDVMTIATGFVLRIIGGGAACSIWVSPWLIVMTFLLTLFIAFGKRRDEVLRTAEGGETRPSVRGYTLAFVDMAMGILAACLLTGYIIYALSPEVESRFDSGNVYLTAIFVTGGILRYLQLAMVKEKTGDPLKLFYRDPFIISCCVLWLASFITIIYG